MNKEITKKNSEIKFDIKKHPTLLILCHWQSLLFSKCFTKHNFYKHFFVVVTKRVLRFAGSRLYCLPNPSITFD